MDVALLQQQFLEHNLGNVLAPEDNLIVTGALSPDIISSLKQAGVKTVINLQPETELTFDEKTALAEADINYVNIPIRGAEDLKQTVVMQFDRALREHYGEATLIHCKSGNRVGAAIALRAGWLRGRKMDTALERGKAAGLTGLQQEVEQRLLVPR